MSNRRPASPASATSAASETSTASDADVYLDISHAVYRECGYDDPVLIAEYAVHLTPHGARRWRVRGTASAMAFVLDDLQARALRPAEGGFDDTTPAARHACAIAYRQALATLEAQGYVRRGSCALVPRPSRP